MKRKQTTQVDGQLMTVDGAARALGMTWFQVDRLVRQGKVAAIKVGNTRLVKLAEVELAAK